MCKRGRGNGFAASRKSHQHRRHSLIEEVAMASLGEHSINQIVLARLSNVNQATVRLLTIVH